jgi:hypothetical protein
MVLDTKILLGVALIYNIGNHSSTVRQTMLFSTGPILIAGILHLKNKQTFLSEISSIKK